MPGSPAHTTFLSGLGGYDEKDLDVYILGSNFKYIDSLKSYVAQFRSLRGSIDLEIPREQSPFLLGKRGLLRMGDGKLKGYTYPLSEGKGKMAIDGVLRNVKGSLYLEHLWGQMDMLTGYKSWYWFIITLDRKEPESRNFMHIALYWIVDQDDNPQIYAHIQYPDGKRETLSFADITGSGGGDSGYPTKWHISIPKRKISLDLKTSNPDQVMPGFLWAAKPYWDGCFEDVSGKVEVPEGNKKVKCEVSGFATVGMSGEVMQTVSTPTYNVPKPIAAYKKDEALTDKFKLLDKVIKETKFLEDLNEKQKTSGKSKDDFLVVIKPNLMMFTHFEGNQPVTYTDPELVEHLVKRIRENGFTKIRLVEAKNIYGTMYENRGVLNVAKHAGYSLDPNLYEFIDLSDEAIDYNYGGKKPGLGNHKAGKTWKNADYRISFSKNKSHILARYTLGFKNIYGTLPDENKALEYHGKREWDCCTIDNIKNFPINFSFIDAFWSSDGLFGLMGTDQPKKTEMIIGGWDLAAVDIAGADFMGYDPKDSKIMEMWLKKNGIPVFKQINMFRKNVPDDYRHENWDRGIDPYQKLYFMRSLFEWFHLKMGSAICPLMDIAEELILSFFLLLYFGGKTGGEMDTNLFPMKSEEERKKGIILILKNLGGILADNWDDMSSAWVEFLRKFKKVFH